MVIYHANTINAKIIYTQQLDQTLKRRKHTTTSIAITRRWKLIFRTIPQHSTSQTPRRKRKDGIERFGENVTKARSHARENVQIKVTKLKHKKKKEKKWKKNEDWIEIININSNNLKRREKIFNVINYYARELRGEE